MGSLSGPSLDEVHCLWPLCSHTCCWEAEQRIRMGKPRKVKALTPSRASATVTEEVRFPTVTMVNASEWPDAGSPSELFLLKSEDDFSESAPNTSPAPLTLPRGAKRQENVQIPNSSSGMPTHVETHRENKAVKLRTIHISPSSSYTSMSQPSKPIVTWVPSSCPRSPHDSQDSANCPRLAVKELIFLPSAEMNKSVEKKKKLNQNKSRKRAWLKQTHLKSQLNQEGKGSLKFEADTELHGLSWPGSDSDPQGQTLAAASEAKEDQKPPRSAYTLHLRKKPVWGTIQRRHTQEEHGAAKYKLDLKTGMDRIDWESLERQTCLWRRHTQSNSSECGRPSPSEDKADYVPYSLHPISMPSSHCQSKSFSTTGPAKCRNMDYRIGIWQNYCQFLASTAKDGLLQMMTSGFGFQSAFAKTLDNINI